MHLNFCCVSIGSQYRYPSRVWAVAQYALLEANAKVNGIGEISHLYPSQIYHYVRPWSRCAKFKFKAIQPLTLCVCVKKGFDVGFFVNISIYPF